MALNVRAALMVCVGVIGGMSWLVQRIDTPAAGTISPLAVDVAPVDFARLRRHSTVMHETGAQRRSEWARQFTYPSALEAQVEQRAAAAEVLALLPPVEAEMAQTPAEFVPPFVVEPTAALAGAEQADLDGLPEVADQPALASAAEPGAGLGATPSPTFGRYRVARGDTLIGIARREWNSDDEQLVKLLVAANPKLHTRARQDQIYVGETLLVPDDDTARLVLTSGTVPDEVVAALAPPEPPVGKWYTVKRNDTLAGIARRFLKDGSRWREIAEANRALNPDRILPGTRIKLPPVMRVAVRG